MLKKSSFEEFFSLSGCPLSLYFWLFRAASGFLTTELRGEVFICPGSTMPVMVDARLDIDVVVRRQAVDLTEHV